MTPLVAAQCMKEIAELDGMQLDLQSRLEFLLKSDPLTIAKLHDQIRDLTLMNNMWTDNIFILRQFICNKMMVSESVVNEGFGIPQDLDLIE